MRCPASVLTAALLLTSATSSASKLVGPTKILVNAKVQRVVGPSKMDEAMKSWTPLNPAYRPSERTPLVRVVVEKRDGVVVVFHNDTWHLKPPKAYVPKVLYVTCLARWAKAGQEIRVRIARAPRYEGKRLVGDVLSTQCLGPEDNPWGLNP